MDSPSRFEWTDDFTLSLIDEYRRHEVLWNLEHPYYKSLPRKSKAWEVMAEVMQIDATELKRKMSCLLSTYRKVRRKIVQTKGKYKITWFAYDQFEFLRGNYVPYRNRKVSIVLCFEEIGFIGRTEQ
ncbi:hypothetical protein NPIL_237201 [Nephila pilipes]|uniref:MADF domain-containing protein n=1 Tax=Nephila pilipes TaxID=299642 RepID=A0A8X6UWV8_NEPPI|nr:hypothetical protein NPIL_237201 [Nephila pilipes]